MEPENTIWHVLFHLEKDYPKPRDRFCFPECFGFSPGDMKILSQTFTASARHCFRATPAIHWLMPALINELQGSYALGNIHSISLLRALLIELKRIVTGK